MGGCRRGPCSQPPPPQGGLGHFSRRKPGLGEGVWRGGGRGVSVTEDTGRTVECQGQASLGPG